MKDIQLTGIGNALIDLQYTVEEGELADVGFSKGTMTLVEFQKQKEIIEKFSDRFTEKMSGGSAANTVIAFSSFGGKAAYKTRLGSDELGKHYKSEFDKLGIHLVAENDENALTGTCFVMITPDSERTLVTSLGANTSFNKNNIDEDIVKRSEWIYIEGYKFTEEGGAEAVHHSIELAKKHDTKVAVSFSDVFIVNVFRDNLEKSLKKTDLIFCNQAEGNAYTGKENIEDTYSILSDNFENIALTLGDKGSIIKWGGEKIEIPSYPTKAIDATGAGDIFAGGFLYGIINEKNPVIAGNLGSYAASLLVSQYGPRLTKDHIEIRDYLKKLLKI